jgi:hypothetical protein
VRRLRLLVGARRRSLVRAPRARRSADRAQGPRRGGHAVLREVARRRTRRGICGRVDASTPRSCSTPALDDHTVRREGFSQPGVGLEDRTSRRRRPALLREVEPGRNARRERTMHSSAIAARVAPTSKRTWPRARSRDPRPRRGGRASGEGGRGSLRTRRRRLMPDYVRREGEDEEEARLRRFDLASRSGTTRRFCAGPAGSARPPACRSRSTGFRPAWGLSRPTRARRRAEARDGVI